MWVVRSEPWGKRGFEAAYDDQSKYFDLLPSYFGLPEIMAGVKGNNTQYTERWKIAIGPLGYTI